MRPVAFKIHIEFHLLREVPHGIPAPPWVTGIGVGPVKKASIVYRTLIGFQFKIHGLTLIDVERLL